MGGRDTKNSALELKSEVTLRMSIIKPVTEIINTLVETK